MTDITELAQSLKAAANTTADAINRLKAFPGDDLIDLSQHEGEQVDIDITTINEWYELASPPNIRTLVEALERAKREAAVDWEAAASLNVENQELNRRIAELESPTITTAAADVLAERQRQVTAEGWTPERDDEYTDGELPRAASCYALMAWRENCLSDGEYAASQKALPYYWPWEPAWWKPTTPRRDLVKAGALILAEIERIDRAAGIKRVARMALAAMDSVPVVYASEETLAYAAHGELLLRVLSQPAGDAIIPLYRHAQPAPVVLKDHQIRELVNQLRDIAIKYHGAGQLREQIARVVLAAMLQAGNSPVIPDGYVMVPKEPTERMVIDGFESEPDETFSEPEVWEAYQKMSGCEQAAFRARLCWAAMIAAAPPAPTQENI
ncbi:hypothetical protein [Klebsiella variicola]|uniref:hypothetical protein n=1 Tax=Klebsiella variicola TaxID=244366 RepID=UPI000E2E1D7C|nr:hypothetical protein [Klebsiella variicola]SXF83152.1 Uncharacterised protein [Klebsiella variicola]